MIITESSRSVDAGNLGVVHHALVLVYRGSSKRVRTPSTPTLTAIGKLPHLAPQVLCRGVAMFV